MMAITCISIVIAIPADRFYYVKWQVWQSPQPLPYPTPMGGRVRKFRPGSAHAYPPHLLVTHTIHVCIGIGIDIFVVSVEWCEVILLSIFGVLCNAR